MTAAIMPVLPESIALAADILSNGGLVAVPTETVYGLACDARNGEAVARLYAAKGRPAFNPLIAHVATIAIAEREARFTPLARKAAEALWPGPLTLVLPTGPEGTVCDLARAGLSTVAIRMPAHPAALALLKAFGGPLVAPSANRSGHVSPTRAEHVMDDLSEVIDLVIDGGPCLVGIESSIVSFLGDAPSLLRSGAYDVSTIEDAIGQRLVSPPASSDVTAPGQLRAHYAPRARLRLDAAAPEPGEGFISFGPGPASGINLSPSGDLTEAASRLFATLRALDSRYDRIAVAPIPEFGLGLAINDRLRRAAHRD